MAQRSAKPYFDIEAFIGDVHEYRRRHHMTVTEMAREVGMTFNCMSKLLCRFNEPSLASACILAEVADLSLDKYRKEYRGETIAS